MFLVTTGPRGTLRSYFKDFPVNVAAKSGTAQQSSKRSEHTTFVAFAPLEDPQISVCVIIPFGNGTTGPAPKVAKSRHIWIFKVGLWVRTEKLWHFTSLIAKSCSNIVFD